MTFHSFKDKLAAIQYANEMYAKGHYVRIIQLSSTQWRVCVSLPHNGIISIST